MMLFTLGGFFKSIISLFKTRVLSDGGNFEAETNLENQLNTLGSDLFNSASLVITPNGVKTSKLYSIKPDDGTGDLSVTRATTATRVNEQGLIETVPYNLITYSEEFENSQWTKNNITVAQNSIISPNGDMTGDKLIEGTNNGLKYMLSSGLGTVGNIYTASVYLKANTRTWAYLTFGWDGSGDRAAYFNLIDGVVGNLEGGVTASIVATGNGWYRCTITGTMLNNAPKLSISIAAGNGIRSYLGDGVSSIYAWGAQLVNGTEPKPYQLTTNRLNVPRIDYTTGSPSILVEPQRTNLFLWSEKFDKASWGKFSLSVTPNTTLSPSGFVNADMITSTNINTIFLLQLITITSGTIYSISFYVKQNTQRFVYIRFTSNATSQNYVSAVFDLQDGTVGQTSVGTTSGTLISSDVKNAGNGFYRVSITASINVTDGNIGIGFAPSKTGNTFNISGSITSNVANGGSIFVWGAQLESGSNATSYIPTTTSSVTRNADVISNTNASNLIGQNEGSIYLEFFYVNNTIINYEIFNVSYNIGSAYYLIRIRSYLPNVLSTNYANGGTAQTLLPNFSPIINSINKILIIYDKSNNTSKLFANGVFIGSKVGTENYPSISMDKIGVGNWFGVSNTSNFNLISFWKTKLTDQQAIQLTTL